MLPEDTVFFHTNIGDTYQLYWSGLAPLPQAQLDGLSITELRSDLCGEVHFLHFDTLTDFKAAKTDNLCSCC